MPGSVYLQSGDYAAFGVPNATAQQISEASTYIDSWCRRPEGLLWAPDAAGNPAYMSSATPSLSLSLSGAITSGSNVQVSVSGSTMGLNVGDALISDRATNGATEVIVVAAKSGNILTLGSVAYPHAQGSLLEGGMMIVERRLMPKSRPILRVMRRPVQRICSARGRYAYQRRGDQQSGNTDDFNLLAVYNTFGGPPYWELINPASTEFDPRTGQLWIPAGIMLAYYTEVEITYLAGFTYATLPYEVKEACAKITKALANDQDLGAAKSYRAGDTAIEKFADTVVSSDIANLLQPYRAALMV